MRNLPEGHLSAHALRNITTDLNATVSCLSLSGQPKIVLATGVCPLKNFVRKEALYALHRSTSSRRRYLTYGQKFVIDMLYFSGS